MQYRVTLLLLMLAVVPVSADYSYSFSDSEYHHIVIVTSLGNGKVFIKVDGRLFTPKAPCKKSISCFKGEIHIEVSGRGNSLFFDRDVPSRHLHAVWVDRNLTIRNEGEKFSTTVFGKFRISVSTSKNDLKMITKTFKLRRPKI